MNSPKFYSRELARDPMQSKRMVKGYEKVIIAQFAKLKKAIKQMFLAVTPNTRIETIEDNYLILIDEYITNPVQKQITDYIGKSVYSGSVSAIQNLKTIKFTAAVGILPIDPKVIEILNSRNISALKGITDDMAKTFKQELTQGLILGEGTEKLAKRISESTGVSRNRARVMVRTETAFAFNTARMDQFKKYNVQKVKWFTARDERTCTRPITWDGETYAGCKGLHNKVFDIDKVPPIPIHCSCRCVALAEVEEIE